MAIYTQYQCYLRKRARRLLVNVDGTCHSGRFQNMLYLHSAQEKVVRLTDRQSALFGSQIPLNTNKQTKCIQHVSIRISQDRKITAESNYIEVENVLYQ